MCAAVVVCLHPSKHTLDTIEQPWYPFVPIHTSPYMGILVACNTILHLSLFNFANASIHWFMCQISLCWFLLWWWMTRVVMSVYCLLMVYPLTTSYSTTYVCAHCVFHFVCAHVCVCVCVCLCVYVCLCLPSCLITAAQMCIVMYCHPSPLCGLFPVDCALSAVL